VDDGWKCVVESVLLLLLRLARVAFVRTTRVGDDDLAFLQLVSMGVVVVVVVTVVVVALTATTGLTALTATVTATSPMPHPPTTTTTSTLLPRCCARDDARHAARPQPYAPGQRLRGVPRVQHDTVRAGRQGEARERAHLGQQRALRGDDQTSRQGCGVEAAAGGDGGARAGAGAGRKIVTQRETGGER
jgi:hypothetical protein